MFTVRKVQGLYQVLDPNGDLVDICSSLHLAESMAIWLSKSKLGDKAQGCIK